MIDDLLLIKADQFSEVYYLGLEDIYYPIDQDKSRLLSLQILYANTRFYINIKYNRIIVE